MIPSPALRTPLLLAHLAISGCWLGSVVAFAALAVAGLASADAQLARSAYVGMGLLVSFVIAPVAIASLVSGIASSLGTRWGLLRQYWVVVKLALTVFAVVVLLVQIPSIRHLAELAENPQCPLDALRATPRPLVHAIGGFIVLLVIEMLGVYKPSGMTRYGWRKQHEEAAQRPAGATAP